MKNLNIFASHGLEILKHSVLLVLYQLHLETPSHFPHSQSLSQKEIREHLGLQHVGKGNNLIRGILEYLLTEESVVYYLDGGRWSISKKGISIIEG